MAEPVDPGLVASRDDGAELAAPGALGVARGRLWKSGARFVGYAGIAYLVLKLIPSLTEALERLQHAQLGWVAGALALETVSEVGFVMSWRAIVDPDNALGRSGGRRLDIRAAWAQLGGGTLVPGGSFGGVGVGAWILHRLGMPAKLIAEREFSLTFLNTAVDGLVLVIFGVGMATGVLSGSRNLGLTLVPAAVAAVGLVAALLVARRAAPYAQRLQPHRPRLASSVTALAGAVEDTSRLLFHRRGLPSVLGAQLYLWFDVLVLWVAFSAVHAHRAPSFAVVVMAYIIGALGGSIPLLPAGIGSIGGMVGMFILYRVGRDAAIAAVVVYQAVGLLVPLVGGGVAYALLRRQLGPIHATGP